MTANEFRDALKKVMPGYSWTVHKTLAGFSFIEATGIQSSGFNRLSTLSVIRRERNGEVSFEAKSAGYGKRAKWLHTHTDSTLARALRGLQDHYERTANDYLIHAGSLKRGRKAEMPSSQALTPSKEKVETAS